METAQLGKTGNTSPGAKEDETFPLSDFLFSTSGDVISFY